jgi:hypothetical protein
VTTQDVPTAPVLVNAVPVIEQLAVLPVELTAYVTAPAVEPPELISEYELAKPFVAEEVTVKAACVPKVIVIDADVAVETLK